MILNRKQKCVFARVCVSARVCIHVCLCECACVCVHICSRACTCVHMCACVCMVWWRWVQTRKVSYSASSSSSSADFANCVFPFWYRRLIYWECTDDGEAFGKKWCSLTKNFNKDQIWKYCE